MQIGSLFGKAKSTISEHIKNIFEEGELNENMRLNFTGQPLLYFYFFSTYLNSSSIFVVSKILITSFAC